jgi:hypothetical protein
MGKYSTDLGEVKNAYPHVTEVSAKSQKFKVHVAHTQSPYRVKRCPSSGKQRTV